MVNVRIIVEGGTVDAGRVNVEDRSRPVFFQGTEHKGGINIITPTAGLDERDLLVIILLVFGKWWEHKFPLLRLLAKLSNACHGSTIYGEKMTECMSLTDQLWTTVRDELVTRGVIVHDKNGLVLDDVDAPSTISFSIAVSGDFVHTYVSQGTFINLRAFVVELDHPQAIEQIVGYVKREFDRRHQDVLERLGIKLNASP
jgi:hypothetical protein